jgi:lipopolysaccharide/colanic/teichoic acid biosynthesis glycosyltransferase
MVQSPVQVERRAPEPLVHRAVVYADLVKPTADRLLAVSLLIILVPLILCIACLVRMRLGRGVIYGQRRVGKDKRVFTMYKFRTMAPDRRCHEESFDGVDRRVLHKCDDDPRHTHLGRKLRRWSLDEIPQLWNVVLGDMSLVGPRPELFEVVTRYDLWEHPRHSVKPGITGLFQISPDRAGLLHENVHYDAEYVSRCTFRHDVRILLRTPRAVLRRQGH